MHKTKNLFTNQYLNDRFVSPFALLKVAIRIGRQMCSDGTLNQQAMAAYEEPDILNPACQILDIILEHPLETSADELDEIGE